MPRFSRRTKIFLAMIALLIVFAGGWIYKSVYLSTGSALQRAESFLFSRMKVARLGEQGAVRYFFITNREKSQEGDELHDNFGAAKGPVLQFGSFDTRVEPSVGLGMFINPSEWFQNEEIRIDRMGMLQQQELVTQLKTLVEASPQKSLLVVVHGFREAFPSALRKTAFLGHVLDINSPILLFDWPGNQGGSLRGYRRARNVAIESGADLAKALELIVGDIEPEKLWVIGNSMGGEVIVNAFSYLYRNPEFADAGFEFEDVVLTAPDVSQEEFDNQFKNEIISMTRNLTVYVSSNDRALVMSRIVNRDSRRGESTLSLDMLAETISISGLMEPGEDLIDLVDVTPVNRTRNFHNFSLETPEFFDDLFLRLVNEENPGSRLLYRFQTDDGVNYWVLTPGR
jgi:esterase/lipase superfamily enzyme